MTPIATSSTERRALARVTERAPTQAELIRWRVATIVAGVAALIAVLFAIDRSREASNAATARSEAIATTDSLVSELEERDRQLADRPSRDDLIPLLASNRPALALSGSGDASGRFIAGSSGALVVADGLPPAGTDRSYVLWLETDAGFERLADLGGAKEGRIFAEVGRVDFLTGWGALTVTSEPGPVGDRPTTDALLEYRGWLR